MSIRTHCIFKEFYSAMTDTETIFKTIVRKVCACLKASELLYL